jgi:dihydrofolate synthase / folylpolyglutamate synthase
MDYDKVTEHIFNLRKFGDMKLGLERVQKMLDGLGNPEKGLKYVHIGGTNGKGSTVAMVSSILSYAGYKVGTYTSPHLTDFTERITIRGKKIPKEEVVRLFDELMPIADEMGKAGDGVTFFEFTTALAIKYFAANKVDLTVMEVGIGGRLDATNVITPIVSVITNIGLEHTEILGDTREKIAREKAGIIKSNGNLVTSTDPAIYALLKGICNERKSKIYLVGSDIKINQVSTGERSQSFNIEGFGKDYRNVQCKLIGEHQLSNAGCAFGAIEILNQNGFKITEEAFRSGLANVVWPGRLELMQDNPRIILDCAKDPLAMKALKNSLTTIFKYDKLITILSISSDKQIPAMLNEIVPISDMIIATRHNVGGRAIDPNELADMASKYGKKAISVMGVNEAIDAAINVSTPNTLICVTGSVFLVGEARERWHPEVVIWGREMNETRDGNAPRLEQAKK